MEATPSKPLRATRTFSPSSLFRMDDLPALGAPTSATFRPLVWSSNSGGRHTNCRGPPAAVDSGRIEHVCQVRRHTDPDANIETWRRQQHVRLLVRAPTPRGIHAAAGTGIIIIGLARHRRLF